MDQSQSGTQDDIPVIDLLELLHGLCHGPCTQNIWLTYTHTKLQKSRSLKSSEGPSTTHWNCVGTAYASGITTLHSLLRSKYSVQRKKNRPWKAGDTDNNYTRNDRNDSWADSDCNIWPNATVELGKFVFQLKLVSELWNTPWDGFWNAKIQCEFEKYTYNDFTYRSSSGKTRSKRRVAVRRLFCAFLPVPLSECDGRASRGHSTRPHSINNNIGWVAKQYGNQRSNHQLAINSWSIPICKTYFIKADTLPISI